MTKCMATILFLLGILIPLADQAQARNKYRKPTAREMYIHRTRMIDRAAVGRHGYSYIHRGDNRRLPGYRYYRQNFRDVFRDSKERDRVKPKGDFVRTHPVRPDGLVKNLDGTVRPYWYPWHINLSRNVQTNNDYYGSEFLTSRPFLRFYWYPWLRNLNDQITDDIENYRDEFMTVRNFYRDYGYPRKYFTDQEISESVAYFNEEFDESYEYYRYLQTPTKHAVKFKRSKKPYVIVDRQELPDPLLDAVPNLYNPGRRFLASPEKPTKKPRKKKRRNFTISPRKSAYRYRNSDNR